jgi:predicted GNAT family N-acyltransferase
LAVHVLHVAFADQRERLRAVREAVFVDEQGVEQDLEWDGQDEDAEHFLALNEGGIAIGCARLLPSGQIGRMAVLADHRGQGIGRQLLDAAVTHAKERGFSEAFLHAQTHATEFYQQAGFEPRGPEFEEAGIPHIEMHLRLPIPFEADPSAANLEVVNPPRAADQGASELVQFDGDGDARDVLLRVIETATRSVEIFSPLLDQSLFGDDDCVELLSEFARRAPRALVRILIVDSKLIVARGHPLLELTRRLTSKIEMRKVPDNYPVDERRSFVVADGQAVWWLPDHTVPTGWADLHNPVQARRVLDEFERLCERGIDDPDLRLLNL